MFGGKVDNFEKWQNSLGMISHKKKSIINIDKEKEIQQAETNFEALFLSDGWDSPDYNNIPSE